MKKLQEQMKALEEEEMVEEEEDAELAKRVAAATAVVPPPPPVPAPPAPAPAPAAKSPEAAPVFKPADAAPDTSKARALGAAKAAAEAELKAAEAEMRAAQAASRLPPPSARLTPRSRPRCSATSSAWATSRRGRQVHLRRQGQGCRPRGQGQGQEGCPEEGRCLFIEPGVENSTQVKAEASVSSRWNWPRRRDLAAKVTRAREARRRGSLPLPRPANSPPRPSRATSQSRRRSRGGGCEHRDFQPKFVTGGAADGASRRSRLSTPRSSRRSKEHEEELLKLNSPSRPTARPPPRRSN